MKLINCRCGKSKKNFRNDIGPFYVDECCKANGYDDLGRPIENKSVGIAEIKEALEVGPKPGLTVDDSPLEIVAPGPAEGEAPEAPAEAKGFMANLFSGRAGGRGKLRDMNLVDLLALAASKKIELPANVTKKQVIEAILANK